MTNETIQEMENILKLQKKLYIDEGLHRYIIFFGVLKYSPSLELFRLS